MKKLLTSFSLLAVSIVSNAQHTEFVKTTQQFRNKEYVYNVVVEGKKIGEFWPIKAINLVTKETLGNDSVLLNEYCIDTLQKRLGGVATTPDGMTTGSLGSYQLQGKALSHGVPCGDGIVYDYGIVIVSGNGWVIDFTHKREIKNFDSVYESYREKKSTLFFLPSIFRNGKSLPSTRTVDKVLIRRWVPNTDSTSSGVQIGVIMFDEPTTYDDVCTSVLGLDRTYTDGTVRSKTTHIYVLDGGPAWGQAIKEVNKKVVTIGTRNPAVVTNYLVFF